MKKTTAIVSVAAVAALAAGIGLYTLYHQEQEKVKELETQLSELSKREKESAVMQSVNAQMEQIADQERKISDEQREKAEQQTLIANAEREKAETEERKARESEHKARESELKAVAASELAEQQRAIAEQQRAQAVHSRQMADTLSYINLGRTLGNTAVMQMQADNHELAQLLAYAAYSYTERYRGNLYHPSVYQALARTSMGRLQWNKHKGTVTDMAFVNNDRNHFYSCSTYGELLEHRQTGGNLQTEVIIQNKNYDFRDIYLDHNSGTLYAVSRTGQLIIKQGKNTKVVTVNDIGHLMRIDPTESQMLLFGDRGVALVDQQRLDVVRTRPLPFRIVSLDRHDSAVLTFDDQGRQHLFRTIDKVESSSVPVKGQVTSFASSKNTKTRVYGMSDGTIYFVDKNGRTSRLIGHLSRITRVKLNGWRLYSSSYDGTINLWMTNTSKIEPMTIYSSNGWITNFVFDVNKSIILTGDQKGNLIENYISIHAMVDRLKARLKRNLTREEWNYYIGPNVPYEKFVNP